MGQLQNFETDLRALISRYASLTANDAHTVLAAVDNELHLGAVALQSGSANAIHALGFAKGGPNAPKRPAGPPAGSTPVWENPHMIRPRPAAETAPTVTKAPAPADVTGAAPASTQAPVVGMTAQAPGAAPAAPTPAPVPTTGAAPAPAPADAPAPAPDAPAAAPAAKK